jgi:dsDNA-specific endonuclease/ATPase MutS2
LKLRLRTCLSGAAIVILGSAIALRAQETDGPLSEAEVESLRDSAAIPMDRIRAFEKILDSRAKAIEDLLAKPHRPGFAQDMHDVLDQFGQIADEYNDNLDELNRAHRDCRKALSKLLRDTERWATVLRSPAENTQYSIVKKIALDNVNDMHEIVTQMQTDEETYFKEHPDAVKAEKAKVDRRE